MYLQRNRDLRRWLDIPGMLTGAMMNAVDRGSGEAYEKCLWLTRQHEHVLTVVLMSMEA